jgi:hypothetical protein
MAIIVEFVGGFRDGELASTASDFPEDVRLAEASYFLSHRGEIGRKHKTVSDAAMQVMVTEGGQAARERGFDMNHVYQVVERTEKDGDTIVRFEYVGQEA